MRHALLVLLGLSACSVRVRDRTITAADLAEPARTRVGAYLSAPNRPGQPTERPWGSIPRAAVEDEAFLVKLDPQTTCVRYVARTHDGLDRPMRDWKITLNGAPIAVSNETITITDWHPSGKKGVVLAEPTTQEGLANYEIPTTQPQIFRVWERTAEICGPSAKGDVLRLDVELPTDDGKGSWGEAFRWKVR
jgi:hypothetical protein